MLTAERVQTLGGGVIADLRDVVEVTTIKLPANVVEEVLAMLARLLTAPEATASRCAVCSSSTHTTAMVIATTC